MVVNIYFSVDNRFMRVLYFKSMTRSKKESVDMSDGFVVPEVVNNLHALLLGGDGAPDYAPEGLLAKKNLSVERLALAAGLKRTSVYHYIAKNRRPTPETLRRLCEVLEISYDEGLKYCTPGKMGRPFIEKVGSQ
jgi:DNA-binding Xre family transcriptional regulator